MRKKEPETSNTAVRPNAIIYCDGCCQPNPGTMAIGVYCDDPEIRISRVAGCGTNNEAECLAAIAALEEAKRLGPICVNGMQIANVVWTKNSNQHFVNLRL